MGWDCLTCSQFLAVLGVNCSECRGDKPVRDDSRTCTAEATAVYTLNGMSERAFSYKAQMDFWAAAAASALEITGVEPRIPWIREAGDMLEIAVTFDPIEASRISEVKKALEEGASLVQQHTVALGYQVEVAEKVTVRLGPSVEAATCVGTSRMNKYTGQCCESATPSASGHNWHRYTWDMDGCSDSCCRTCAEINEARGLVKPSNSEWVTEDEACHTWTCLSWFVKSEHACVQACSAYSSCSDCTASACVWCASQQRCSTLHADGCANRWVADPGRCRSGWAVPQFLIPLMTSLLGTTAAACVYWSLARRGSLRGRGQEQHPHLQASARLWSALCLRLSLPPSRPSLSTAPRRSASITLVRTRPSPPTRRRRRRRRRCAASACVSWLPAKSAAGCPACMSITGPASTSGLPSAPTALSASTPSFRSVVSPSSSRPPFPPSHPPPSHTFPHPWATTLLCVWAHDLIKGGGWVQA
eukprot:3113124-Rhodomonas_salina.1